MASIEPEIEFGVDEITLREQVQAKLADEAAAWKGGTLSTTGAGSISSAMIGGMDTSNLDATGPNFGVGGETGVGTDYSEGATGDAAILKENVISNLTEGGAVSEAKQFEQSTTTDNISTELGMGGPGDEPTGIV